MRLKSGTPPWIFQHEETLLNKGIRLPSKYTIGWAYQFALPYICPNLEYTNMYKEKDQTQDGKRRVYLEYGCSIHGTVKQRLDHHVEMPIGCTICQGQGGLYDKKYFEQHPHMMDVPAIFYIIRFTSKAGREIFVKVGITQGTIKKRFSSLSNYYNYDIIASVEMPLYECWLMETECLRDLKSSKYIPNRKFGGYTECFKSSVTRTNAYKEIIELLEHNCGLEAA